VEPTLHQMIRFWNEISAGRESFVVEGISTYPMGFLKYEA